MQAVPGTIETESFLKRSWSHSAKVSMEGWTGEKKNSNKFLTTRGEVIQNLIPAFYLV